ncbi:MAG: sugar ABC transporter substrate-binding protein, partial [Blastocatellia bacterium]|nr:sugar ABC transporter substrate-binding protein [Blastocatellia bacterium]
MPNLPNLKFIEIFIITLLAIASLFAGCARQPAAPDKPRIALIMKSLANEFFQTMENGAKAHQQAHAGDYELIANGIKDEQDVSMQIDLVEQMIAQRVDAIVIAPADSKSLITVCKRALDAGIPVINIDNKFDAAVLAEKGVKIPFVGPDNRKGARLAGEYLAKRLKAGDNVAILEGVPNAFNGVQRRLGFDDAMNSARIVIASSQAANWETSMANQLASSIITEQPELKAILCANDNMALGAVAALKAAGRAKDVFVIGFDNISAVQQLIRDGQILATVDQH